MNPTYPTITIDLVLDRLTAKEALRAVLHSVLFHRLFGTVKEQSHEVLDVTMPGIDDPEMKQLIEEKVDAFWKGIEGGISKRGQIIVTFSEKRPRKTWFIMGEEEIPWEQWYAYGLRASCHLTFGGNCRIINAEMRQPVQDKDRQIFNGELASVLTKSLETMLNYASSERGRSAVPIITNANGISPFPIKITVKIKGVEVG
ncbi:uncharacterized protein LAESUDRAFT_763182 [Laetiporus sulphureus 93-53]|uniref:Autophagy-related protein 101 n=1 Tax=Laetiporus sulphureus 93-53 TaxID=1314785 RepID=A0A165C2C6_9APHY|nr:uncharacterized protein LAESUDRAFT_763182 [Laetiporus sulphureus 93-53]KZT02074.1 hypothetical protein LAESUDRAFT_763182 [Laetiporus sulphureus 93-53]